MISPTEQYSNSVRTTHPLQPNIREVQIIDFHIGPRKNFLVSHFIPIFLSMDSDFSLNYVKERFNLKKAVWAWPLIFIFGLYTVITHRLGLTFVLSS